jgi:hypothetical protein
VKCYLPTLNGIISCNPRSGQVTPREAVLTVKELSFSPFSFTEPNSYFLHSLQISTDKLSKDVPRNHLQSHPIDEESKGNNDLRDWSLMEAINGLI